MSDEVKIGFRDRILMNVPLKQKMLLAFYGSLLAIFVQIYNVWGAMEDNTHNMLSQELQKAVSLLEIIKEETDFSFIKLQSLLSKTSTEFVSVSLFEGNHSANNNQLIQHIPAINMTIMVSFSNMDELPIQNLLESTLISSVIFVVIIFVLASSVSANLLPLIDYIIEVMKVIAAGRLDRKVGFSGEDEFGQLGGAIDGTIGNIRVLIELISKSVAILNKSTKNIDEQSTNVFNSVGEQHKQIDLVVTAIEQLNISIQEVANNSNTAESLTSESQKQAQHAKSRVSQTINSIESLSKSVDSASVSVKKLENNSEKIGSVVAVIESVSAQTNLLALNAAIEAARAGDQGRGFAVVADEVRQLAQRTQQATIEIQAMVAELQSGSSELAQQMASSVSFADAGVEQVNEFVDDIDQIVGNFSNMTEMNISISSSLQEQSQVTEAINESIHTIRDLSTESLEQIKTTLAGNDLTTGAAKELNLALKCYNT